MTDVSNLDELAGAIASSSQRIKAYSQAQAAATQSQEVEIRSLDARLDALEAGTPPPPPPPPSSSPDVSLPSPPQGTLGAITDTAITISWQPSSDNVGVHHYNVFRGASAATLAKLAETTGLTYTFAGLTAGTDYALGLEAVDVTGNKSALSQAIWFPVRTTGGITPPPPPPPPPPTGDKLLWAPPAQTSPVTVNVTDANRRISLGQNQDAILVLPSSPLLGRLAITGGRYIRIIGGEIRIDSLAQAGQSSPEPQYGIYLAGGHAPNCVIHIEGVRVHGAGSGGALVLGGGNGTVQVQNCRLETAHPVWHTADGDPAELHTDAIQSWSGPAVLRLYKVTLVSRGLSIQVQPQSYYSGPFGQWHYEKVNCYHTSAEAPALNKSGNNWWAEYHRDFWLQRHPNHTHPVHVNWNFNIPGWNPGGGTNVTGESMHIDFPAGTNDVPPGGDFCPVGVAGIGYVPPGYQ